MPAVLRETDLHIGHAAPCAPFHRTQYNATHNETVYIDGLLAIVYGDFTACGDPTVGKSSTVFVNDLGVHREGDSTAGHGTDPCGSDWVPNAGGPTSSSVYAG
jgi:uncharacterized Zn-binding protein involved in type VI secretion